MDKPLCYSNAGIGNHFVGQFPKTCGICAGELPNRVPTSSIGLPDNLSRDDAYVQGIADGEKMLAKEVFPYIQHTGQVYCHNSEDVCNCGAREVAKKLREIIND